MRPSAPGDLERRALEQFLFGMAAVTVGAAALLAIYYLGFRDRSLAMLAPGLSALLVLALIPALVGFLVARGRRGNG